MLRGAVKWGQWRKTQAGSTLESLDSFSSANSGLALPVWLSHVSINKSCFGYEILLNYSGPGSMPESKAKHCCLSTNSNAHGSTSSSGQADSNEHCHSSQVHPTAFSPVALSSLPWEVGPADGHTHSTLFYQGWFQSIHLIGEQLSFLSTRKVETQHELCQPSCPCPI